MSSNAAKAEASIRGLLKSQAGEGNARQERLQRLGINVEKTVRLDRRIFVWVLADHVLHDEGVKIEKRVQIGIDALNACAVWALKGMDDAGARDVLKHYRKLLAQWERKKRELSSSEDAYAIVTNSGTIRKRITDWAMGNLVPWMEMIADASWGQSNTEPEIPIVLEGQSTGLAGLMRNGVVDQRALDQLAKMMAGD